jgi:hypothetical protein
LSLGTIADGVAEELFQNALERVLKNAEDPNTVTKAARRITLSFDVKVNDERTQATVTVGVSTKLAGSRPHETFVRFGMDNGELIAREALPQESLFPKPHGEPRLAEGS